MQSYLHIKIGLIAIVNSKTKLSQKMAHDTLLYTANLYEAYFYTCASLAHHVYKHL